MVDWMISQLPPHITYLDVSRSQIETINDLVGKVVNLFCVIRVSTDERKCNLMGVVLEAGIVRELLVCYG